MPTIDRPTAQPPVRATTDEVLGEPDAIEAPAQTPSPVVTPTSVQPPADPAEGYGEWWWLAALAGLVAVIATFFWWRARKPLPVPTIERPTVPQTAAPAEGERAAITLTPSAKRLTRSMMALSFDGEVSVLNRSARTVRGVTVSGQLTTPNGTAKEWVALDTIAQLGPGQSRRVPVSLRLPLQQVVPMRQGGVPIVVPLLRLETAHDGGEAKRSGYAVGPAAPTNLSVKGTAGRVQPIRLDEPPRSFDPVLLRPFDDAATAIDETAAAG